MPIVRIKDCLTEGPCKGQGHEWEFAGPRLKEQRKLQSFGLTLGQFEDGLNEVTGENGPQAVTGLLYLLHHRAGFEVRWEDVDAELTDLALDLTPEEQAEYDQTMADLQGKAAAVAEANRTSGAVIEVDSTPRSPSTPPSSGSSSA